MCACVSACTDACVVLNVCVCDVHALYERVFAILVHVCVFVLVSHNGNTMCITLSYAKTGCAAANSQKSMLPKCKKPKASAREFICPHW